MKNTFKTLALVLTVGFAPLAGANTEGIFSDELMEDEAIEARQPNTFGFWECRAQAPRLIRVFKAKGQGFRDDIQDQALDACNAVAVFQCWPLGCTETRVR